MDHDREKFCRDKPCLRHLFCKPACKLNTYSHSNNAKQIISMLLGSFPLCNYEEEGKVYTIMNPLRPDPTLYFTIATYCVFAIRALGRLMFVRQAAISESFVRLIDLRET